MSAATISIVQSNYIPWRGYFDLIRRSDLFVIGDNVQYTKQDWRNRNLIKTPSGLVWLTIPVVSRHRVSTRQRIDETRVADLNWCEAHLRALTRSYRTAPFFHEVSSWLFSLFADIRSEPLLTTVNVHLLRGIAARLGINTPFMRTSDLNDRVDNLGRSERILALCQAAGASRYLTGPSAKTYLEEPLLQAHGIAVEWMEYPEYPQYPQLWGPYEPRVSVVDLLFNTGPSAADFITPL